MFNRVQPYAWGSTTMLAAIQRRQPTGVGPEAELWMGTHPQAPSDIETAPGSRTSLLDFCATHPETLGSRARSLQAPGETVPGLPFLFKILSVERGLSIQAHPDRRQAEEGFLREDELGIPRDSPIRTYRDPNHKPEMICALTDFWGLCRFRLRDELVEELSSFRDIFRDVVHGIYQGADEGPLRVFSKALDAFLEYPGTESWRMCFVGLLRARDDDHAAGVLVESLATYARGPAKPRNRYWWVQQLLQQYPGDVGAFAPLYLNLVHLRPGKALFLSSGLLHAYLHGAAVEIMANSDNVLRSGCTIKHVDTEELARRVQFESGPAPIITDVERGGLRAYPTSAEEFELFHRDAPGTILKQEGPAIVLNVGDPVMCNGTPLGPGQSLFVDAETDRWMVGPDPGSSRNSPSSRPGEVSLYIAALPGVISAR
jgi:mannose-6-phosphate isomerase